MTKYEASGVNALVWKTSYVYLGGQLLATTSGTNGTETRFHHPDRLGTRLVTDAAGTVVSEQLNMPFGNMLPFTQAYGGENSYQHPTLSNPSKKRFTTYDRSEATRLDYAVNRFYSPQQGRFTQVDPIGMGAAELANPQSLNLYAYVENDPINSTDPLGLDGPTFVFRPYPTPPGGGSGGGGLRIGPISFSFSFGGGSFLNFGSLQQSKKKQPAGISKGGGKVGDLGIIVVSSEPPDIGVKVGGGSGANPGGSNASDDEILDALQHTLDTVGLIPGFGEPADFFSAGISFGRGDYVGVGLSLAAMIPVAGMLATLIKFGRKVPGRAIALGKDIAGGGVKALAEQTGAPYYKYWKDAGITRRVWERHFGRAFHQAVKRADTIHFTLDGIPDVNAAVHAGRRGFIKDNFTNAELHYIRNNPHLLQKTIFYRNGQVVPSPF